MKTIKKIMNIEQGISNNEVKKKKIMNIEQGISNNEKNKQN